MAFDLAVYGQPAPSAAYNQLAAYFNGSESAGSNPISLITLNDATKYVLLLKQLDTSNGRVFQVLKADGTRLMTITKTGVTLSVDGTTQDQVPAVLSAIQTFSAAITMGSTLGVTGVTTLASSVIETRAANTASATTLTLPAGKHIPITGTTAITSIVAGAAGRPVVLEFASAGCIVSPATTLRLNGKYISTVGGTLSLESDGTNWNETGCSGGSVPGARYRLSAANTSIVSGAERTVTWTASDYNYGMTATNTAVPVPGVIGRWQVSGGVNFDWTSAPECIVFLLKNGSDYIQLFGLNPDNSSVLGDGGLSFSRVIEVTSITDTFGLGISVSSTINMIGGASKTSLEFTYLGR